ncbi:restriction endonuclease subunit S [Moraxella bovoculi]|nr:restriction endonuclease subunit S [Moraxella bovoculi]
MSDLPMGWAWTELGNYIYVKNGYAFKSSDYIEANENTMPVIRISDIQDNEVSTISAVNIKIDDKFKDFFINNGDLLIAMSGATTGKIGTFKESEPAYQNQRVGNIKLINEKLGNLKFRYYLIQSLSKDIFEIAHGGAQPNISGKAIEQIEILLPPKAEQDHIATLLDKHLSQVAKIEQKLNDILPILKQFRQSVLTQAASGRLLAGLDFENWATVKLSEISQINPKKGKLDDDLEVSFSPMNLMPIKYGEPLKFEHKKWAEVKKGFTFFKENDILVAKITPCFENGKSVVATNLINGIGTGSTEYHIIRTDENTLPAWILFHFKMESFLKEGAVNMTGSVGHKRVPKDFFENFDLKLPPLPEQQQIVSEVERLFALADSIGTQVNEALSRVGHLTQSILHQAFMGNLSANWREQNSELITGEHSATAPLAKIQDSKQATKRKGTDK